MEASKNMMVTLIYTEGSPINLYSYLEFNINQKVIYQDNDDILLIFNGNNFDEKLDNIIKIMNNKKTNYIIVGSEPTNDIEVLREYYKLALNCMNVCKKTSLWGIWKMNDFPLHSILLDIKETSHYKYIKANVLFPIIDFDKEYNAELLKSLYMYNNLGSISKAAKYLQIHVNTLRYRLEKIYDITGLDMNIPKDNIQLAFAVAIADLENITNSDWKKCYMERHIERGYGSS